MILDLSYVLGLSDYINTLDNWLYNRLIGLFYLLINE
jgi:hypothetical protein